VAQAVAAIKQVSFDEVANSTTYNFKNFFLNEKN
jgi:Tat protein secretion system quality control protein TatD with DNase activity